MSIQLRLRLANFGYYTANRRAPCIDPISKHGRPTKHRIVNPTSIQPHSGYNNFARVNSSFNVRLSNSKLWARMEEWNPSRQHSMVEWDRLIHPIITVPWFIKERKRGVPLFLWFTASCLLKCYAQDPFNTFFGIMVLLYPILSNRGNVSYFLSGPFQISH